MCPCTAQTSHSCRLGVSILPRSLIGQLAVIADGLVFHGNTVVSMRPYKVEDIERVRDTTRPYLETHGEPIAWVSARPNRLNEGWRIKDTS